MGENLLPCPFCGADPVTAEQRNEDGGYSAIECGTCYGTENVPFVGVHADSPERARAAWNTRAPTLHASLAEARARIAALEAGLRDIADKAPKEEPETYEGDNHGDSYSNGWKRARYFDAQIARTLLDANAREVPE